MAPKFTVEYSSGRRVFIEVEAEDADEAEELAADRLNADDDYDYEQDVDVYKMEGVVEGWSS